MGFSSLDTTTELQSLPILRGLRLGDRWAIQAGEAANESTRVWKDKVANTVLRAAGHRVIGGDSGEAEEGIGRSDTTRHCPRVRHCNKPCGTKHINTVGMERWLSS